MKTETRKGKDGVVEKKCAQSGEWKPETEKYYYRVKKTGEFRVECKVCTAPFQKYRIEPGKKRTRERKARSTQKEPSEETMKKILLSKRHTYKMNPDTIDKIDIMSNVSGLDKGVIITQAIDYFIEHNEKYELMIAQYKKLIKKFRD